MADEITLEEMTALYKAVINGDASPLAQKFPEIWADVEAEYEQALESGMMIGVPIDED